MSRPSTFLRDAAQKASSSTSKPVTRTTPRYVLNPLEPKTRRFVPTSRAPQNRGQRTHHMVIADVPKTATPQDVLRALIQNNIVEHDFPISGLTMPPPSCPRGPSLVKNVHLTMHDVDYAQAHHATKAILARPLFPDTSSWAQGIRPASNLGLRPNVPAYPSGVTAHQWTNAQINALYRTGSEDSGRDREQERKDVGWKSDSSRRGAEVPSVEWCMDSTNRGRRILLRGTPGLVPEWRIRKAGVDYGVEPNQRNSGVRDDVRRLPASAGSFTSTWVITTDTVNNACRFVRKYNRQYWLQDHNNDQYLLRAEIIW